MQQGCARRSFFLPINKGEEDSEGKRKKKRDDSFWSQVKHANLMARFKKEMFIQKREEES